MVGQLLSRLRADQRIAFLGAGAFNTAFGFTAFTVLQLTIGDRVGYLVVLLLAHVIGVLEAFVVYRHGVFKVSGSVLLDLARFESVYLVALGINVVMLAGLVELVGLPVLLAQGCSLVVTAALSYVGHKHFSFRRKSVPA